MNSNEMETEPESKTHGAFDESCKNAAEVITIIASLIKLIWGMPTKHQAPKKINYETFKQVIQWISVCIINTCKYGCFPWSEPKEIQGQGIVCTVC